MAKWQRRQNGGGQRGHIHFQTRMVAKSTVVEVWPGLELMLTACLAETVLDLEDALGSSWSFGLQQREAGPSQARALAVGGVVVGGAASAIAYAELVASRVQPGSIEWGNVIPFTVASLLGVIVGSRLASTRDSSSRGGPSRFSRSSPAHSPPIPRSR